MNNIEALERLEKLQETMIENLEKIPSYIVLNNNQLDHIAIGTLTTDGEGLELTFTHNDQSISFDECKELINNSSNVDFLNESAMQEQLNFLMQVATQNIGEQGQVDYLESLGLKKNAGYYILAESQGKAVGFSPMQPEHIVIWDRTVNDGYVMGAYGNTLNHFKLNDLRFMGVDTAEVESILKEIGYDYNEKSPVEITKVEKQFIALYTKLEAHGLLPDDYFIYSNTYDVNPLDKDDIYFTNKVDFGGSEGIYIDVYANENHFATGKTLAETPEAFMKMSQLGAAIQMSLNGNDKLLDMLSQDNKQRNEISVDTGKKTVYVCSPLAGEIIENIHKAREYSKFVAEQGYTPIAPHITELFDDTIPKERELGLALGIDYLKKADSVCVFGNRISNGMANEIRIAQEELHIPVFHVEAPPFVIKPFDKSNFINNQTQQKSNSSSIKDRLDGAKNTNLSEPATNLKTQKSHERS